MNDSNKKTLIAIALVLAVVVVLIVAKGAGNKDKILAQSFLKLLDIDSAHSKADLSLNLPVKRGNSDRPFTDVEINIEGDVIKKEDKLNLNGTLYTEAKGRGNILFADGDIVMMDDNVAFRLDNLPVLLNSSGSLVDKWTYVDSSLLKAKNSGQVKEALKALGSTFSYQGKETIEGESLYKYSSNPTPEAEAELQKVFGKQQSDSPALNSLSRLLVANNIKRFEVWVAPSDKEIRKIEVNFVRPLANGNEFDFATLALNFSDYGKKVDIPTPKKQLTVRPEIFAKLFGSGEVTEVTALQQ